MNRWAVIAVLTLTASTVIAAKRLNSPKALEQITSLRVVYPAPTVPRVMAVVPSVRWITNGLAWDYPTNEWNAVTNFMIYRGVSTNRFTGTNSLGKVLTTTITRTNTQYFAVTAVGTNGLESLYSNLLRVPTIQNLVVHVTVSGGATNIYHALAMSGPWSPLGTTNYWVTNQFGTHYYRGNGKAGNRVAISMLIQ